MMFYGPLKTGTSSLITQHDVCGNYTNKTVTYSALMSACDVALVGTLRYSPSPGKNHVTSVVMIQAPTFLIVEHVF